MFTMAADQVQTYDKLWITDFFHTFPHIDFSFDIVNSTFDPNRDTYKQALGFWVLVPVAVCILLWLVFLFYFIFQCCQQQRESKGHSSSCQRILTALLILLGAALAGFGFYENESAHNGIDDIRNCRHDVNNILITASQRVETLEDLAVDISTTLSRALVTAATNITNSTVRNMVLKLISEISQEAIDARDYLDNVKVEETDSGTLDNVFNFEYFRWMITVVIFSLYVSIFLLSLIGLLIKSKGTLITSATVAVVCSFFIWLATGLYLSLSVAAADLCSDPDAYFIGIADGSTAKVAMTAYVKCTDPSLPYAQVIDNAIIAVFNATVALNKTSLLAHPYKVTGMDKIVSEMNNDLQFSIGNLSLLLQNVGRCPTIHHHYMVGVNSACTTTILQSEYVSVDDKDPFLPRPPPYETDYGTMGRSSPRPWSERGALQHVNTVSNEDQVMTLIYQHPYPTDESPPPAYHPGQFMERCVESGPTPSSMRSYFVK